MIILYFFFSGSYGPGCLLIYFWGFVPFSTAVSQDYLVTLLLRCCRNGWWISHLLDTRSQGLTGSGFTGALAAWACLLFLWSWLPGILWFLIALFEIIVRHVMEECVAVEACRIRVGIRAFLASCMQLGWSKASAYQLYVSGKDEHGSKVPCKNYLLRGASLAVLTDTWLSTWEWWLALLFVLHCWLLGAAYVRLFLEIYVYLFSVSEEFRCMFNLKGIVLTISQGFAGLKYLSL